MFLPIFHIDVRNSSNQKLQLSFVKNIDQIRWYQLVKARDERIELLFDALLDSPLGEKTGRESAMRFAGLGGGPCVLDIFFLIFVRDLNVLAAGLEVNCFDFTENIVIGREVQFQACVFDWSIPGAVSVSGKGLAVHRPDSRT